MNPIPFYKKCRSCGLRGQFNDGTPGCSKFKIKVNPDEDFCSWHEAENINTCCICGTPSKSLYLWLENDEYHTICEKCFASIGKCPTCQYNNTCELMTDQSEPPYVMQTVQQGMMIMQTQVKNPSLVNRHCPSCRCSYGSTNCIKDNKEATCNNWVLNRSIIH